LERRRKTEEKTEMEEGGGGAQREREEMEDGGGGKEINSSRKWSCVQNSAGRRKAQAWEMATLDCVHQMKLKGR
jgi:hypothetical protein